MTLNCSVRRWGDRVRGIRSAVTAHRRPGLAAARPEWNFWVKMQALGYICLNRCCPESSPHGEPAAWRLAGDKDRCPSIPPWSRTSETDWNYSLTFYPWWEASDTRINVRLAFVSFSFTGFALNDIPLMDTPRVAVNGSLVSRAQWDDRRSSVPACLLPSYSWTPEKNKRKAIITHLAST